MAIDTIKRPERKTFRLAVLNAHPVQYFAPLYAFLNKDEDLEVTALYCSDFSLRGAIDPGFAQTVAWDIDLLSGYNTIFLGSRAHRRSPSGFWSLICPEVWREIRSQRYDAVIIHGYAYAAYVLGLLAAISGRVPVFFRGETHLGLSRPKWKRRLRDLVLAAGSRLVSGYLAIGTANRSYYRSLGISENKIFDAPYSVDNERFNTATSNSCQRRAIIRSRYGIAPDAVVVLYASKLTPRKHPDDVIRAIAILRECAVDVAALIVGSGELEDNLHALAKELAVDSVKFAGFLNQSKLPDIFAASDIFVLPSENEPWGLIVNEAMCAGLPVIVGNRVGCAPDLVKDNLNGFLVTAGDPASLARALKPLVEDRSLRRRFGSESLRIIGQWSYNETRQGIIDAIQAIRGFERPTEKACVYENRNAQI